MNYESELIEIYAILGPVFILLVGVILYSIFIYKFYKFIARKDVIRLNLNSKNFNKNKFAFLHYILEYLMIIPIFVFFWFVVLSIFISFMAQNQTMQTVYLISIAVVGAIRAVSYYDQYLAEDIAKTFPLTLLAVFVVEDIKNINLNVTSNFFTELIHPEVLFYYMIFIVGIEIVFRTIDVISTKTYKS